ncbi:MAG: hypothetical protein IH947_05090 [Bacteroidetes bacterium]|nr:hypothetical protein [Bacteroidota bacterium]
MGLVVGIGGVSRAGKSTLSKRLKNRLPGIRIIILDMDDFVFPENEMPRINDEPDWETPESIDYTKLSGRINETKAEYDLVIVEGILIFCDESLNSLIDKKLFLKENEKTGDGMSRSGIFSIFGTVIRNTVTKTQQM